MKVHPDCPKPDISDDVSLTNWDIKHKPKLRSSFSHIPKERWEEIFMAKKPPKKPKPCK